MQETPKIDYLEIFKASLQTVWKKKLLWIFGLFITLGSAFNNVTFNWKQPAVPYQKYFQENIFGNGTILAVSSVIFLLVIALFIILKIIGRSAIITAVGNEIYVEENSFSILFKQGKRYLKKLFLLDVFFTLVIFALLLILSTPVISLVLAKSNILAIIFGLFAFLIFLPISILAHFVKKFSYMYIVLSGLDIRSSVENSYTVFKDNLLKILIFSMLLVGISIIFGLSILVSLLLIGMPVVLLGFILTIIFSKTGLFFSVGLGLFVFAIFFIIIQSAFESFKQTAWTLFFKEVAGIKIEKEEVETKAVPEEALNPEHA